MCESLFVMSLRPQISDVSCCASEFSHAVLKEASNRLVPPHRFAIAAEIASVPSLIGFLKKCSGLSSYEKSGLTTSQLKVVECAEAFTGNIHNLLFQISDDQITEPELKCLETPPGRVSSVDMAGFLRLPQELFPDSDYGIQQADVLLLLCRRFDLWKEDNKRNH